MHTANVMVERFLKFSWKFISSKIYLKHTDFQLEQISLELLVIIYLYLFRICLNNYKSDFETFMKIYSKLYGKTRTL